jgi:DNA-binding NarL/FixJ family response regulator
VTEQESRIRVAIVDDHRMLLGALTEWIRSAQDIDMVAAVASWPELLTHPAFPVDVVLLDLDLKDNIPISLKISTLKTMAVKVVLMSTYSEPNVVREALGAGALGYLVKSEDASMIIEALRAASIGESFVSAELDLALNAGAVRGWRARQGRRLPAQHLRGDRQVVPQAHPREVPRRRVRRRHEGRPAQARDRGRHPHRVRPPPPALGARPGRGTRAVYAAIGRLRCSATLVSASAIPGTHSRRPTIVGDR